jgi:hypothetical protein
MARWFFSSFTVSITFFGFQFLFRPKHHWRDFISRNAHLVYQTRYHKNIWLRPFTLPLLMINQNLDFLTSLTTVSLTKMGNI